MLRLLALLLCGVLGLYGQTVTVTAIAGSDQVSASRTTINNNFTNLKTFVEADFARYPRIVEYAVAKCFSAAPVTPLNVPSANAPVASCDSDGKPVLTFAASSTTDPESFFVPSTATAITGTIYIRASASASTLSGNAVMRMSYACTAIDGTGTSLPTLSSTVDVTITLTSTAANLAYPGVFSIPLSTCAGKRFAWKLSLVSRTLAADPQLINTIYWVVP